MVLTLCTEQSLNNDVTLANIGLLTNVKDKFKLSISDIMIKYGSYDNYINTIYASIDDEFMDKYYPEHKDDIRFR